MRNPLREMQNDRCFYCDGRLSADAEVDHFVPWARYPNNALANLVVADPRCNHDKRDHLAAPSHVRRWSARAREQASELDLIAGDLEWDLHAGRSLNVARAIYLRLPARAQLWRGRREFVPVDRSSVAAALG